MSLVGTPSLVKDSMSAPRSSLVSRQDQETSGIAGEKGEVPLIKATARNSKRQKNESVTLHLRLCVGEYLRGPSDVSTVAVCFWGHKKHKEKEFRQSLFEQGQLSWQTAEEVTAPLE